MDYFPSSTLRNRNDQKIISGNQDIDPEGKTLALLRFSWQDFELIVGVFTSLKVSNFLAFGTYPP